MSNKVNPILTVSVLDLMPDDDKRYELFEGEIFVSRAPALSHQRVLANLVTILESFLRESGVGKIWPTPGVVFDDLNAAIADIAFVRSERLGVVASRDKITGAPDLIVEILSAGSADQRRDRIIKRQVYSKFLVSEYWIVDRFERLIEIYRLHEAQLVLVATLNEGDVVSSTALPGLNLEVGQVFNE